PSSSSNSVRTPTPAPYSSTTSPGRAAIVSRSRPSTRGSIKKCCPNSLRGRSPYRCRRSRTGLLIAAPRRGRLGIRQAPRGSGAGAGGRGWEPPKRRRFQRYHHGPRRVNSVASAQRRARLVFVQEAFIVPRRELGDVVDRRLEQRRELSSHVRNVRRFV